MKTDGKPKEVVIHIHDEDDEQVVEVSIAGLGNNTGRDYVLERVCLEARKLISVRAMKRRFRPPIETHFVKETDSGDKITGALVAQDARGRKASVRVEITV